VTQLVVKRVTLFVLVVHGWACVPCCLRLCNGCVCAQDGLTNEEMRPYIVRVMHKDATLSTGKPEDHLDAADWMTYSTALLVKAMLEFENYKTM
jgi:hypothetical protein